MKIYYYTAGDGKIRGCVHTSQNSALAFEFPNMASFHNFRENVRKSPDLFLFRVPA